MSTSPYTAEKPPLPETTEQLRARIPGWGADLDPAVRPQYPHELPVDTARQGAHWDLPDSQPDDGTRERSIEHARLPPVFGTAQPLHGLSGAVRRLAYERFSEGRTAHWLLLVAGDRVDAVASHLASFTTVRPDDPITQTGVRSEISHHGVASRRGRVDTRHHLLDPVLVAGPWVLAAWGAVAGVRRLVRSVR